MPTGKLSWARGRYGESRIAKLVNGVIVGRSKFINFPYYKSVEANQFSNNPSTKTIKIDHQHPPDIVTPIFAFESKYRRDSALCSRGLSDAMLQAETNASLCEPKLIPVCVIKDATRKKYYYVLEEKDFISLWG